MSSLPPQSDPASACAAAEPLLAAYALGIVEPDERRWLADHLAACAACRAELASYERTLAALDGALEPVPPPAGVRARLLAEIGATERPPAAPPRRLLDPAARWRRLASALAAVAALLLLGVGVTGFLLVQARGARDEALADRRDVVEYLQQGGTITALAAVGGSGGPHGSLIVAPDQPRALLVVAGLRPAGGSRYRVWAERGGQRTWLSDLEVAADGTAYLMTTAPEPVATYDSIGLAVVAPNGTAQDLLRAPIRSSPGARPATPENPAGTIGA